MIQRASAYVGCSAADDSASRIQMITTLLRKLDCAAAFPAIAAFLDHPELLRALARDEGAARPRRRGGAAAPQADGRARSASRGRAAPRAPCSTGSRPRQPHGRPPDGRASSPAPRRSAIELGDLVQALNDEALRPGRRGQLRRRRRRCSSGSPTIATSSPSIAVAELKDRCTRQSLREPLFEPGDHAPPGVGEIFHPRQFLAVGARQRVQGERHLALLLPRAARPQFLVPHRRLSRPRLLERILRI